MDEEPPRPASPTRRLAAAGVLLGVFGLAPVLILEHAHRTPLRGFALATVLGLWCLFFVVVALRRRRRSGGGALALNVAVLLGALAAVEIYAGLQLLSPIHYAERPAAGTYTRKDDLLGYEPVPGSSSRWRAMAGEELISDVTYTIDRRGHRIQPPLDRATEGCVLCFGCSLTFGWGLDDEATWPWRLQERLDGRYRVHNLAFSGYGPQQMLAALQGGRVREAVREPPRHAFFLTFRDHIRRVSGKGGYAANEPRFVLLPDGGVQRAGLFGDVPGNRSRSRLRRLVRHSNVVRLLTEAVRPEQFDLPLFLAVIEASRDHIREAWPDCRFRVLHWESPGPGDEKVRAALAERGIEVWSVSDLIPGLREDPAAFRLHVHDPHPNARATEALATSLAARIDAGP